MTISAAAFTNGGASTVSSATTASKTWVLNRLYLMNVITAPTIPSIVVGSTNWTQINTLGPISGVQYTSFCFLGDGSTGVATINCGTSQSVIQWGSDEIQGTVITGVNGSNAIVQSNASTGSGSTASTTLSAFGDPINNAAYASAINTGGATQAVGSGYTALTAGFSYTFLTDEYKLGQDLAPNISLVSAPSTWLIIAMELRAPATYSAAAIAEYHRNYQ